MVVRVLCVLATALVVCGCQNDSPPPQTSQPRAATPRAATPQTAAAPAATPQVVLVKPGGTPQQFSVDRYECMQSSQTPMTRTAPDAKGTQVTTTAQVTNGQLYAACMNTRGYYATRPPDPSTSCAPLAMTPAQLADGTRISPAEKAVLLQARRATYAAQDAVSQVMREGSLHGQKVADLFMTTYRPQFGLRNAERSRVPSVFLSS